MSLVARLWFVAAVLSGAVLVVLPAISSAAETHHVAVVDNAYDDGNRDGNAQEGDERRGHTLITAGDTVVWQWDGENQNPHTVTSRATAPVQFDSDAECGDDKTECRQAGSAFVVRFDQPGTYDYFCKIHSDPAGLTGMTGTIEVQPPPEPSESDSGSSEPSSEETSEPPSSERTSSEPPSSEPPSSESEPGGSSSSPEEEPNPEPTSEEASETEDDPDGSSDDDGPPRREAVPGFGVGQQPRDTGSSGPRPQVAPEVSTGPSFSPFPSAPDLPSGSETEDMAVTVPSRGGGPSRGVVVGVAVASVLGSAGVFGKVVLFGQPWG